jgi:hypothetical protein
MTHSQLVSWIQANADQLAAFFLTMPGFATMPQDASGCQSHTDVAAGHQNAPYSIVAAFAKESADDRRRRLCKERTRRWRAAKRLASVQQASHTHVSLGSELGSKRGECEGGERGEERTPFFASQGERHRASPSVARPLRATRKEPRRARRLLVGRAPRARRGSRRAVAPLAPASIRKPCARHGRPSQSRAPPLPPERPPSTHARRARPTARPCAPLNISHHPPYAAYSPRGTSGKFAIYPFLFQFCH